MADPEILRYLSARLGLGLKYLSKDEKISIALEQIRDLFPEAILKGGTALNRVHLAKLGVSRFSEDLDLDFPSDKKLSEKISTIKTRIPGIKGFEIDEPRIHHRTLRLDCYYINEFNERDRIKIEFYLTNTEYLKIVEVLVKSPFIETHPAIFKIYSLEDLMARKLITLYNRMEGKDIYDLFYSLDLDYDKENLNKALKIMLEIYKINQTDFEKELIMKLKTARKNASYIGNTTNHFIPRNLRPNWKILIDTLISKIEETSE